MLKINGKEFRNLEEQVLKNQSDIKFIKNEQGVLNQFGIKVVGQGADLLDLPTVEEFKQSYPDWEYGDTYAIGTVPPYSLYVLTRANVSNAEDYWFDIGDFPAPGPKGDTGEPGPVGPAGERGLQGPQGIQGIQGRTGAVGPVGPAGSQGVQGERGPQGLPGEGFKIIGILNSTSQLPTPTEEIRSNAYLIEIDGYNHLFVIVGENTLEWFDAGSIEGIQGPQGVPGIQGPTGPAGPAGSQGETGPAGPQGVPGIQGPRGETGETGPAGPMGPAGTNGIDGVGFTYLGNWTSGNSYSRNDVVYYEGSTYVCKVTSIASSTTSPDNDTASWGIMAQQGAQGSGLTPVTKEITCTATRNSASGTFEGISYKGSYNITLDEAIPNNCIAIITINMGFLSVSSFTGFIGGQLLSKMNTTIRGTCGNASSISPIPASILRFTSPTSAILYNDEGFSGSFSKINIKYYLLP